MRVKNVSDGTITIFKKSDSAEEETSLEPGETSYADEDQQTLVKETGDGMPVSWALQRDLLKETPMGFYDLVDTTSKLDFVRHAAVANDGMCRSVEIELNSGPALSAAQALEDPELWHGMSLASGGQQSEGTYEVLTIGPKGKQTDKYSVTPDGQAVKGGLSPEEVLEAAEKLHEEAQEEIMGDPADQAQEEGLGY